MTPKPPDRGMAGFDLNKFWNLASTWYELSNGKQAEAADILESFIQSACAENFKAGQRNVCERLLKGYHSAIGSDDFFEGVDHCIKMLKQDIEEIRREVRSEQKNNS